MAKKRSAPTNRMRRSSTTRKLPAKKPSKIHSTSLNGPLELLPLGYAELLRDLKSRVRSAQIKASLAVNRELIELYWEIGGLIVVRQQGDTWGTAVIDRVAADLQAEFPGISGFSRANLFRMRSLYLSYSEGLINVAQPVRQIEQGTLLPLAVAPQPVAQPVRQFSLAPLPPEIAALPWGHNLLLLEKLDDIQTRLWYALQTALHGWSRNVLAMQIQSQVHLRQGKAITNFQRTLPPTQSDLAQQLLKDPYTFD